MEVRRMAFQRQRQDSINKEKEDKLFKIRAAEAVKDKMKNALTFLQPMMPTTLE